MTRTKDELEEAADDWAALADREGYRCERCGEPIPYEERDTYFKTKLCAWCLNQAKKDD
jgi:RNA polymerase-binding transcription factor DksA